MTELGSFEEAVNKLPGIRRCEIPGKGPLLVIPNCPPQLFPEMILDEGLGHFAHYSSIIQKTEAFQKIASAKDGRVAVALFSGNVIVAYAACWYPGPGERWNKLGELMYEMGAIEVSRNFRGAKLSEIIFDALMENDFFEDKIAYMNGFSWHWDLDGTGLTMSDYRKMMMKLFRRQGYKEFITNEPNIALREENVFMARIGARVSEDDKRLFRNLRFGIGGK
jgi:acetoin utilization protein AcuA